MPHSWLGATCTAPKTCTDTDGFAILMHSPVDITKNIENATEIYEIRKSYETSVPKLNWKANEACMNLLKIIAMEIDEWNFNREAIDNATSIYEIRETYETSVPKLDWKANEACMNLLVVILEQLNY